MARVLAPLRWVTRTRGSIRTCHPCLRSRTHHSVSSKYKEEILVQPAGRIRQLSTECHARAHQCLDLDRRRKIGDMGWLATHQSQLGKKGRSHPGRSLRHAILSDQLPADQCRLGERRKVPGKAVKRIGRQEGIIVQEQHNVPRAAAKP